MNRMVGGTLQSTSLSFTAFLWRISFSRHPKALFTSLVGSLFRPCDPALGTRSKISTLLFAFTMILLAWALMLSKLVNQGHLGSPSWASTNAYRPLRGPCAAQASTPKHGYGLYPSLQHRSQNCGCWVVEVAAVCPWELLVLGARTATDSSMTTVGEAVGGGHCNGAHFAGTRPESSCTAAASCASGISHASRGRKLPAR
mmetsp:Transcript_53318/g.147700  ORF Transcript_53318/g.147700 Transcript_53318/m.147700 type:complete len:200 (-) Transcript_53318:10-609(-)